jgi:hypothetical protein
MRKERNRKINSNVVELFIVGWALPTKNNPIQLLTVGNAHPTGILLESTNGKFQIHQRISFHAYTYAVGKTNST